MQNNDTLYGLSRLINISSGAIFGFLPLCVAYSTVKRFGGRPIMGIVIGCIMLTNSLADAYAAAQGTVEVTTLHIFGFGVDLVGFQGGIIESQLLVDTGRNFLNPLMSVAIIAQGGAVLGYLVRNLKDAKAKELCIPSFISVLFGITEPALFGVNLRYRYPLIGGCLGGAVGGLIVYFTDLAALGFGTTVVPGIALADPANNGYLNYVIAHVAALAAEFVFTILLSAAFGKKKEAVPAGISNGNTDRSAESKSTDTVKSLNEKNGGAAEEELAAFTSGEYIDIEKVSDPTFAQKVLGDGAAIVPAEDKIYAPADAVVEMVMDTKHAVGLRTKGGNGLLIHVGIDTVNLQGKYFDVKVREGQELKKGDCILTFDREQIEKAGYDTATSLILTEPAKGCRLEKEPERAVGTGDRIAVIRG